MVDNVKKEIDFDALIANFEKKISKKLRPTPQIELLRFDKDKFAGVDSHHSDRTIIYLNSYYFSSDNGKYYLNNANLDLTKMRLTHELMHVISSNNGKSGIEGNNEIYKYSSSTWLDIALILL